LGLAASLSPFWQCTINAKRFLPSLGCNKKEQKPSQQEEDEEKKSMPPLLSPYLKETLEFAQWIKKIKSELYTHDGAMGQPF